jgi:hypothetical protein
VTANSTTDITDDVTATATATFNPQSPLYQRLPDCRDEKNFVRISKKTSEKGLICPMFRDEEGFLAEFVVRLIRELVYS